MKRITNNADNATEKNQKMTIKDIAQMAGVSPATVSNVLNGRGRVSKETTLRVSQLIEEMDFNLNSSARTLRHGSSRIIGILVPFRAGTEPESFAFNSFYWEFMDEFMKLVRKENYEVILKPVSEETDLKVIQERNLDGIVVIGAYDSFPFTKTILACGIPLVFVDSYLTDANVNTINLDDRFGAYLATRHLTALGHTSIGFVSGQKVLHGVDHERFLGYCQALNESGYQDLTTVFEIEISMENGRELAHKFVYDARNLTGLVTTSDSLAIGLMRGFQECGVKVPDDISIVGFDDITTAAFTTPALTTIRQDVSEKAGNAAKILIQNLKQETTPGVQKIQLTPKLIIRESTGAPKSLS